MTNPRYIPTKAELKELLFTQAYLQDALNLSTEQMEQLRRTHKLAALVELTELVDWMNWKWWKAPTEVTERRQQQVVLELADILHFLLIGRLVSYPVVYWTDYELDNQAQILQATIAQVTLPEPVLANPLWSATCASAVLELAAAVATPENSKLAFAKFFQLISALGVEWPDVYRAYYGKVALNRLRADYGYNTGDYPKQWAVAADGTPLEDNDVMLAILRELATSENSPELPAVIYNRLASCLNKLLDKDF